MAVTIKQLGNGNFTSTSIADLYTVGTGKAQIVKSMRFTNTSTSTALVLNIYLNAGSDRQISPKDMTLPPGASYIDDSEITLEAMQKLRAKVSTGAVDWVVSGVERDQS